MPHYLEVGEQAARQAGDTLRRFLGQVAVREKAPKDLVTDADLASQRIIRQTLLEAFPDHAFLGEEEEPGVAVSSEGEYCWVVDPLDGTANFAHQLPNFSVSIALRRGEELLAGIVYDPVLDECFTASRGDGAYLNGTEIQTSECREMGEAMVAASFPPNVQPDSPEVAGLVAVLPKCQTLRRMGSAALNLAYVAAGRLDAYWATSVKIWDVAAGTLLIREAGGTMTAVDGTPLSLDRPRFAAAGTVELHADLVQVLRRANGSG